MPQVLEILLLALLLLALAYLLRPQEGWAWARRHLKGLVDFREVEAARKLEAHLADLREVLASLREGKR